MKEIHNVTSSHEKFFAGEYNPALCRMLYTDTQLETVPAPVLDENIEAHSYTHLKVRKPYIALNSERYFTNISRIKIMQENRKWVLLWRTFHCKTQI